MSSGRVVLPAVCRHATRAMVIAGVFLAACTSDGGQVSESSDLGRDSASVDERPSTTQQVVFDGVTFAYSEVLADMVVPGRLTSDPDAPVSFEFTGGSLAPGSILTVVILEDRSGTMIGAPDDATQQLAIALSAADDSPAEQQFGFVNGEGRRVVSDSQYRFDGLSFDGRFLVRLEVLLDEVHDLEEITASLDALVASIFIDGTSGALGELLCEPAVEFVTDIPLPGGNSVRTGDQVTKSWTIRNSGDCPWERGLSWSFTGGDPLEILETTPIEPIDPGEETVVAVTVRVPVEPGKYAAQWQVMNMVNLTPLGPPAVLLIEAATS